jgi:iron complex outermembrane recepter protein
MKLALKYLLLGFVTLFSTQIFGQQTATGNISGNVIDEITNESIAGVQIYILELSIGTTTNNDGSFRIDNIPPGKVEIQIKMIGYQIVTLEKVLVKTRETNILNIKLTPISYKTGEIVISASKMNSLVKDIPSAVYVIEQKEIELSETRNIQDVLKKVSGVFTEDRRHQESNLISFRGIGLHSHVTRGILILVDGISVNEAMGRASFEGIDLESAESVEVLKGPVSALYGPNGITGVINVVSKEPLNEFSTNIKASFGSYNSQRLSGSISGGLGEFNLGVTGAHYTSDGYQDRSNYASNKIGFKLNRNHDYWGIFNFSANYIYSDSEHGGTLDSAQFADRETLATRKFTGNVKDLMRFTFAHQKFWGAKTSLSTNVYYRSRYDEGHYMDSRFGKDDLYLFGGEIRFNTTFDIIEKENNLIAGLSIEREDGKSKLFSRDGETGIIGDITGDATSLYNMFGFYLQTQYELFDKLKLLAGIRYDVIQYDWADKFNTGEDNSTAENSVSAISPKFGFTYNGFEDISIYGNMGKGFNPPQIEQLFSSTSTIPNPDLKPEYLTNYEIGIRGNFTRSINYQISFYTMDFQDQVVADGDDPRALVYENIGETTHKGFESAINFSVFSNACIYFNHSFTEANFVDHPDYNNNQIRKVPKHQFGVGINYTSSVGVSATLDYKWVDKYFMDNENTTMYEGYSVLDAKVIYRWKGYLASLNVNNLFDANYATYTSYSQPSRYSAGGCYYYPGWPRNFTLTLGFSI